MQSICVDTIGCLEQGLDLLGNLTEEQYCEGDARLQTGTVGAHIRHNTDHYECLFEGILTGHVHYDRRGRNPDTETQLQAGQRALQSIVDRVSGLEDSALDQPLHIHMHTSTAGTESVGQSNTCRELQFLLSHTIHHYALIAILCRVKGIAPPENFGVAPSTLNHRNQQTSPNH